MHQFSEGAINPRCRAHGLPEIELSWKAWEIVFVNLEDSMAQYIYIYVFFVLLLLLCLLSLLYNCIYNMYVINTVCDICMLL